MQTQNHQILTDKISLAEARVRAFVFSTGLVALSAVDLSKPAKPTPPEAMLSYIVTIFQFYCDEHRGPESLGI